MRTNIIFPLILMLAMLWGSASAASTIPIPATLLQENAIGLHAGYFKEADARLALDDAIAAYEFGKFSAGDSQVLNFGIGSKPVWVRFSVDNPTAMPVQKRLSIETAWLDKVDVYVRHRDKTIAAYRLGDSRAFSLRPVDSRYFAIDHAFEPGASEVFVRVETPDPMVVPIYLMTLEQAHAREKQQDYSYGFLYGFLFALLAFNATLYASLRNSRYILYSLYLGMFMLMNISYTGHGFQWLWPAQASWAQWSNPVLMLLYGISGLFFALRFLDTRRHFPRVHKAVLGYCAVSIGLLVIFVLLNNQTYALLVAFTFAFLFTAIMLALGVISVRAGQKPARYFLLAAAAAMVGAGLTTLAVWGFIPHNIWTFRAVDIGMLMDATLLALALAYQFRVGQQEKVQAEQLAQLDPLTGINNRRAFYDRATPIWNSTLRHGRNLSVVLLDIDNFKQINDAYGHAHGDEVLIATANALMQSVRQEDVAARWGGEEFILLLPETDHEEAVALAERLRVTIAGIRLKHAGGEITFTASFGVAQRETHQGTLDSLISTADSYLYQSKEMGRNRVSHSMVPLTV
jgi:diguanylate cyclase (GGDEF)-like protein